MLRTILIISLFFACLAAFSAVGQSNGLIAYWNIEAGNNWRIEDVSGRDNHGYNNGALRGVSGQQGIALLFDGNDYVNMGDLKDLDFSAEDSFTLTAWVKLDEQVKNYAAILGKADDQCLNGYMLRHNTDGQLSMRIVGQSNSEDSHAIAQQDYRDGQWHQLAGVINRADQTNTVYVDGVQRNQVKIEKEIALSNNSHFNLGGLDKGNVPFKGLIDEVRIYQRALSGEEIQDLYQEDCPDCPTVYPAGSLLSARTSYKVYYINQRGEKKWIINQRVFDLYQNDWSDVISVEPGHLVNYPDVYLMKGFNQPEVYLIEGMSKRWLSASEFAEKGYQWDKVDLVIPEELEEYSD